MVIKKNLLYKFYKSSNFGKLYKALVLFIFIMATVALPIILSLPDGFMPGTPGSGFVFAGDKILFPLKTNDSVSATFGEYRSNHLHAGVDLRTQRRNGIPVIAPSAGQILNLYGDENGYGLMLTFKADNGLIYKFAHLSAFESVRMGLDGYVKKARAENNRRFNFNIDLSVENICVEAGDIIAYSGDTGAGPSHLHFEINAGKRNDGVNGASAAALNPFTYLPADELKDETPINITAAIIMPDDPNSLVEAKPAGALFNFKNEGTINLSVNAIGKIKMSIKAFDENKLFKDNESKMGVYKVELSEITAGAPAYSGITLYSLKFDSIGDKYSKMPEIVYDMYYSKISGGNFYYNMFYSGAPGERPEYVTAALNDGVIEIKKGEKRYFQISAFDYFNNVSKRVVEITGSASRSTELSRVSDNKKTQVKDGVKKRGQKDDIAAGKIAVEYLENVMLFKIKRVAGKSVPIIYHGGFAMNMFDGGGYCNYYKGYGELSAAPEITVKYGLAGGDEQKFGLKLYEMRPGETVKLSAHGDYMIKLTALSDPAKPFYAGEMNLISAVKKSGMPARPAANPNLSGCAANSSVDIGFSRPGFKAKIYYKIADAGKISYRAGLYQLYSKNKIFLGNTVEEFDGSRYLSAPVKNLKRLCCGVFTDEKPPVLKISKKSGARLLKPLKLSAKAENNFLSFSLYDAESRVDGSGIKYYIDGVESGNFEYFSGALLNCYLYDIRTGNNLSPGAHKIKIIAADNSGNKSVYEKEFKIVK